MYQARRVWPFKYCGREGTQLFRAGLKRGVALPCSLGLAYGGNQLPCKEDTQTALWGETEASYQQPALTGQACEPSWKQLKPSDDWSSYRPFGYNLIQTTQLSDSQIIVPQKICEMIICTVWSTNLYSNTATGNYYMSWRLWRKPEACVAGIPGPGEAQREMQPVTQKQPRSP